MVKTFCPFAGDRARRAERPVLTQGRALVAFGRVSAWAGFMPSVTAPSSRVSERKSAVRLGKPTFSSWTAAISRLLM